MTLTASETTYMAADKPVLIAANALDTATTAKWVASDDLGGTDRTATNYPIKRAYDRHMHLVTKPSSVSSPWHLAFDLGSSPADFDMVMIGGHNFSGQSVNLYIQKGTDATFASDTTILSAFAGTGSERRVGFMSARETGQRFVRLRITGMTVAPEIGELWLGRRRHLPYKFDRTLDDLRQGSEIVPFESRSGIRTNYTLSRGQSRRTGSMLLDDAADVATVEAFWSESAQGTRPFLFCENPNTAPSTMQLMNQEPELDLALVGPYTRSFSLNMREAAPFVALES